MNNREILENHLENFTSEQSRRVRRSAINCFFEKFGYNKPILEVTFQDLKDYQIWLKNLKGINLTTKKLKWALLKSFIEYLMEENDRFIVKIPKKTINWKGVSAKTKNSNKEVYASKEEIERILQYYKGTNFKRYVIFRLMIETGARKGEIINAKTDELDLEERSLHTYDGKTGEKRYFFSERFTPYLMMYLKERQKLDLEHDYLFVTVRNTKYNERIFNAYLKTARERLGIKKRITCHTFRRTLNDFREEMNCPLEVREKLLGHKTNNVNVNGYTRAVKKKHLEDFDRWDPYHDLVL